MTDIKQVVDNFIFTYTVFKLDFISIMIIEPELKTLILKLMEIILILSQKKKNHSICFIFKN